MERFGYIVCSTLSHMAVGESPDKVVYEGDLGEVKLVVVGESTEAEFREVLAYVGKDPGPVPDYGDGSVVKYYKCVAE